jgi:asparagine N-glycosylation enzyme membrane subunit Stt3
MLKTGGSIKFWFFTIITGIVFGVWILAWAGQWFMLWLIGGFFIVKIIFEILRKRKIKQTILDLKIPIFGFVIILAIYFLIGSAFLGTGFPGDAIRGPFSFGDIKGEENREFPNVYVSVAELQNPSGIKDIIQKVTAINIESNPIAAIISPFFLMIYGLLYLGYSYIKRRDHFDTLILLLIWFIGPLVATLIAIRFSILFSAPMAICSAIFITMIYEKITETKKEEVKEA